MLPQPDDTSQPPPACPANSISTLSNNNFLEHPLLLNDNKNLCAADSAHSVNSSKNPADLSCCWCLTTGSQNILRTHGMSATVIQHVFRAVVVAKLSYASPAWSGFTSAADLQHINAFLRRGIRQGFCSPDLTDITVIFDDADEILFRKILSDGKHLLAPLLPSEVCTPYHLRPRRHNRQLIPKVNKLCDSTSSSACYIKTRTDFFVLFLRVELRSVISQ